jgi:hypothetical protein
MSAARAKLRVAGYQMIGAGYVAKEYIIEPSPAANLKHEAISSFHNALLSTPIRRSFEILKAQLGNRSGSSSFAPRQNAWELFMRRFLILLEAPQLALWSED